MSSSPQDSLKTLLVGLSEIEGKGAGVAAGKDGTVVENLSDVFVTTKRKPGRVPPPMDTIPIGQPPRAETTGNSPSSHSDNNDDVKVSRKKNDVAAKSSSSVHRLVQTFANVPSHEQVLVDLAVADKLEREREAAMRDDTSIAESHIIQATEEFGYVLKDLRVRLAKAEKHRLDKEARATLPEHLQQFKDTFETMRGHKLQLPLIKQLSPRSEKSLAVLPAPHEKTEEKAQALEAEANKSDPLDAYKNLGQSVDDNLYRLHMAGMSEEQILNHMIREHHEAEERARRGLSGVSERLNVRPKSPSRSRGRGAPPSPGGLIGLPDSRGGKRGGVHAMGDLMAQLAGAGGGGRPGTNASGRPHSRPPVAISSALATALGKDAQVEPTLTDAQDFFTKMEAARLRAAQKDARMASFTPPPPHIYTPDDVSAPNVMDVPSLARGNPTAEAMYAELAYKSKESAADAADNYNTRAKEHIRQQRQQQRMDNSPFMDEWRIGVLNDLGVDVDNTFTTAHKFKRAVEMVVYQLYTQKVRGAFSIWADDYHAFVQDRIERAGLIVTRLLRGFMGRCRAREMRRVSDEAQAAADRLERERLHNEHLALVKINGMLRRRVYRMRLKTNARQRRAATAIQRRLARGPQGRALFRWHHTRRQCAVRLQCFARTVHARRRRKVYAKIVGAQGLKEWRAAMNVERLYSYRINGASCTMWRYYNAYVIRKKLAKILYWNRVRKFTNAQRVGRGFIARMEYRRLVLARERAGRAARDASTLIQKRWHGYVARKKLWPAKLNEKLVLIRRRKEAKASILARKPPKYYIRKYLRKYLRPLMCFRYVLLDHVATQIQRIFRGFHGRRRMYMQICLQKVDAAVALWHLRMASAAKIQRCNAGFMVRRLIIAERRRVTAIKLQSSWRRRAAYKCVLLIKVRREYAVKLARSIGKLMAMRRAMRIARTNRIYGDVVVRVQRLARRFVHGKLGLMRRKYEMRADFEFKASAGLSLVRALCALQLQIINETMDAPMGKKWRAKCGVDCEAYGPVQALYIGILGGKGNFDRTALLTNRMDLNTLNRWWQSMQEKDELSEVLPYEKKKAKKTGGRFKTSSSATATATATTIDMEGGDDDNGKLADVDHDDEDASVAASVASHGTKGSEKSDVRRKRALARGGGTTATEEAAEKTPEQVAAELKAAHEREIKAEEERKRLERKARERAKKLAKWRVDPPPYNSLMQAMETQLASLPRRHEILDQTDLDIVISKSREDEAGATFNYSEFCSFLRTLARKILTSLKPAPKPATAASSVPTTAASMIPEGARLPTRESVMTGWLTSLSGPSRVPTAASLGFSPRSLDGTEGTGSRIGTAASGAGGPGDARSITTTGPPAIRHPEPPAGGPPPGPPPGGPGGSAASVGSAGGSLGSRTHARPLESVVMSEPEPEPEEQPPRLIDFIPRPEEIYDIRRLQDEQEQGIVMLVVSLMWGYRDEPWMRSVAEWLENESRARLAPYVSRIQRLARVRRAYKLRLAMTERKRLAEELQRKVRQAIRIQTVARIRLAKRRVMFIAVRHFTKFIPTDGDPYWYNPSTKINRFTKPALMRTGECLPVRVPAPGMECVTLCVNCSSPAVSNCVQCEESMCRVCFDALHCKGNRRKHRRDKIPLCSYCKYQVASKTCLTCFIKKPVPGSVEEHMSGERGLYCDNCFTYMHDELEKDLERDKHSTTAQKMDKLFVEQSTTIAKVETGIRRNVETDHTWSHLMQPCEECEWRCASFRCLDCKQVYCSKCLTGMHSLGGIFAAHTAEPLPYYTIDMHKRFNEDEMFHKNKKKMDILLASERILTAKYELRMTIKIQSWWRMCMYRVHGRKHMKDMRRRVRKMWKLRRREDLRNRSSLSYRIADFFGLAEVLRSDTKEEKVLKSIPWPFRRAGQESIWANRDDWGFFPGMRKGEARRGFDTDATISELRQQALYGGSRMPGRVHCIFGKQIHKTDFDLTSVVNAGEYVRVRELIFVVLSVGKENITLDRNWPRALTEEEMLDRPLQEEGEEPSSPEVLFKLPSYRGQRGRRYFKMKYTVIRLLMGNPLFQTYFSVHSGMMRLFEAWSRDKFDHERALGRISGQKKYLRKAMQCARQAVWAENYLKNHNELVQLADQLTPEQKEALRAEKERVKEEKRREKEALKAAAEQAAKEAHDLAMAAAREASSAQDEARMARAAAAAAEAAAAMEAELLAAEEAEENEEARSEDADLSDSDDGLTEEQRLQKHLKESGQMWLADNDEVLARKRRYDAMSPEDIMEEAVEWKEMMDPITENVFWLHEATMEKMHNEPYPTKLLREKKAKDEEVIKAKEAAKAKLGKGAGSTKKKRKM